jgi:hypothetical protein
MSFCSCSTTEEEYDYSKSIEKIIKEKREERDQKFLDFSESRSGRVCRTQMRYNEAAQAWELHYRPENCAQMKCFGYCPILGKNLDRQKGNVYYDVKLTYRRYDLDGTFFEGQVDTQIVKGKRFFKNPVSMDICKAFVKLQKDDLKQFVLLNQYHTELFFAKTRNLQYSVEILNIRAEHRESRDLFQDLEDLKAGILITHESDKVKADKAVKSQRRQIAKEKRIHRLEKKVLETGYEKLEPFEQEKISRLLGADRLAELEKERAEKPVVKIQQLNLLDFA